MNVRPDNKDGEGGDDPFRSREKRGMLSGDPTAAANADAAAVAGAASQPPISCNLPTTPPPDTPVTDTDGAGDGLFVSFSTWTQLGPINGI